MSHETWLITGGAGYIGSHIADAFLDDGKDVIIYDSLYRGLESRIEYLRNKHKTEIPLIIADIRDIKAFNTALRNYKPDGVIHTAALKSVTESIKIPDEYFEVNFQATRKLLETISSHGIHKVIYSSTAAVYGAPDHGKHVEENEPKNPISPYGASKLAAEDLIVDFLEKKGNTGTSLRFFNVIGAASRELLDNSTDNLVPIVIDKIRNNRAPEIFGTNYPTPDGTCVRDYVDVRDIAAAHLVAANATKPIPAIINVGTGRGASVREIVKLVLDAINKSDAQVIEAPRRAGDPAFLCANVDLAATELGFKSKYSLEESIRSLF